ncbi:MAG: hypothetical protein K2X66_01540 [Cyanobacteria bacterium]|nr:hypothetical protein [Cyanobacteriota bacterium]
MSLSLQPLSPRFSGVQLIQIHGDQSSFPDHFSLRFVPYTPNDQVDLYNNKAFGDNQPTATYKNALVGRFSETKVNRGIIPNLAEAKKIFASAIDYAPVTGDIKNKFQAALDRATYVVKLTHQIWDGKHFQVTGYYGPDGELKGTHGHQTSLLSKTWDPSLYNAQGDKSSGIENKNALPDNNYVAFETASSGWEAPYWQKQS